MSHGGLRLRSGFRISGFSGPFSRCSKVASLLASRPVLSTGLHDLVLAFPGVPSIKDIIRDTVWLHRFFSEFSVFRAGADQAVHSWSYGAGSDVGRCGDEVNLSAAPAHDAHVNRHDGRLWHFATCLVGWKGLRVRKKIYFPGPSRAEVIARSMPPHSIHTRAGATQSPALLNTFFARCSDTAGRI